LIENNILNSKFTDTEKELLLISVVIAKYSLDYWTEIYAPEYYNFLVENTCNKNLKTPNIALIWPPVVALIAHKICDCVKEYLKGDPSGAARAVAGTGVVVVCGATSPTAVGLAAIAAGGAAVKAAYNSGKEAANN
jgi:hypothetical protein